MSTSPFNPAVAQVIGATHSQTVTALAVPATGDPFPLSVEGFRASWDEDRSPRVIVQFDCVALATAEDLARFDPRTGARVRLTVSYRLPDGTEDSHQIADLGLRERTITRPDNLMHISCASDEALYVDAAPSSSGSDDVEPAVYPSAVDLVHDAIWYLAVGGPLQHAPGTAVIVDPALTAVTTDFQASSPTDSWSQAQEAVDALDGDLFDNGDRQLRLNPRSYTLGSTANLALTVGLDGTIVESASTVSREQWFNLYGIRWKIDADPYPIYTFGRAAVDDGPYRPEVAGLRVYAERGRVGRPTQAVADAICRTGLRRSLARARSYAITAVSAWWLRPGDTIAVTLASGVTDKHLVSTIEHRNGGLMRLVTRLPDTQSVIGE